MALAGASEALFTQPLLLLGGAVIAAPIFRKLGLGTVLGYLAAGVVIGPVLHLIGGSGEILEEQDRKRPLAITAVHVAIVFKQLQRKGGGGERKAEARNQRPSPVEKTGGINQSRQG